MLPRVNPRLVVVEDGVEYVERFRRFLGDAFELVPARSFAEALDAAPGAAGLLLDLDFRRAAPEALVDESGQAPSRLDAGTRRRLSEQQGILVLRALRDRGVTTPALLFADVDDVERARFLERSLAPLTVVPSRAGLREIGALLEALAAGQDP
jgi:hypothetical protein